jgi:hypothetical protein
MGAPILETPDSRRDEFVDPYFKRAKPNDVVCIIKGREPADSDGDREQVITHTAQLPFPNDFNRFEFLHSTRYTIQRAMQLLPGMCSSATITDKTREVAFFGSS